MTEFKKLVPSRGRRGIHVLLSGVLAVAMLGLAAAPAAAILPAGATINTTVDQSLGDCSVTCSLRDAVALSAPGDTLAVPAGHYVLTLGHITITQDLTLVGDGARTTVIDGNNTSGGASGGIFDMRGSMTFEVNDLSLVNGLATGAGGAISAVGRVVSNPPLVFDAVTLIIRRCTIANNRVTGGQAGGVHLQLGSLVIEDSTFSGNSSSPLGGGGLLAFLGPGLSGSIVNSTFSGNSTVSFSRGGAMTLNGPFRLANLTITGNTAQAGAGITNFGSLTLTNTIVAGNTGGNCFSTSAFVTDHNLASDNTCGLTGPGDLPGVSALLGPLTDNGGPTDTHALLVGSPALDAGGNATCTAADQRGVARPQRGVCDIGAVEMLNVPPALASDSASVAVNEGQTAANSGTVSDGDGDAVTLTASVGSVANNGDGTWSWSFATGDGPTQSQTVTITGDDGQGGVSTTSFSLVVNNVAPTIFDLSNDGPVNVGGSATITVSATDPAGANDPLGYSFDCDDNGSFEIGPQAGNSASCTFAGAGSRTVHVQVTDGDGGTATGSTVVTVLVPDTDGDGFRDDIDNCPLIVNPTQTNFDLDGFGDACDADIDGDGRANAHDLCPFTPPGQAVGRLTGCSIAQICPCDGPAGTNRDWRNHGQYVACVTVTAVAFRLENVITTPQKVQIITAAAQSSCGR